MKMRRTILSAGLLAAVSIIQSAQATTTLGQLVSGNGSINIGDKTFSNFGWFASGDAPAAASLNGYASGLSVSATQDSLGVYYLDFGGFLGVNNLAGAGALLGDLKLTYTVTANPGSISMIDQSYVPNGTVGGGQIIIGETVKVGSTVYANSTLTLFPTDLSDPAAEAGDNLFVNPNQHTLNVTKDILIAANPFSLVGLSDVEQSFHQIVPVPEASTVVAGALLMLPFGASAIRIMRKK